MKKTAIGQAFTCALVGVALLVAVSPAFAQVQSAGQERRQVAQFCAPPIKGVALPDFTARAAPPGRHSKARSRTPNRVLTLVRALHAQRQPRCSVNNQTSSRLLACCFAGIFPDLAGFTRLGLNPA
jgi:hypothetical protein